MRLSFIPPGSARLPCAPDRAKFLSLPVSWTAIALVAASAEPAVKTDAVERLKAMSFEDLLNREVTSVSKRSEKLFASAAAVFVIDNDDLRRSGARSLPEALRLAPGLSVAQLSANQWAVASRGFAGSTGNLSDKLLVLVDGRSVHGNIIPGVDWHLRQYPLEDIERIEVIRGPGGTLWGANAVNGVINIITKSAADTEGGTMTSGTGIIDRAYASARYGLRFGETSFLRVYGSYLDRANFPGGYDGQEMVQGGFRLDCEPNDIRQSVHGDYFSSQTYTVAAIPSPTTPQNYFPLTRHEANQSGANLVWTARREFSEDSDAQLMSYVDWTRKREYGGGYDEYLLNVDFQHRFALPGRQDVTYGLGYRYYPDRSQNTAITTFDRPSRNFQIVGGFVQDEVELLSDQIWATLGTKVEHNDLTGVEVQPSARVRWTPSPNQTVWGAVSRAIQMPSASVNNISVPILGLDPVGTLPSASFPFVPGIGFVPAPGTPADLPIFLSGRPNTELKSQELVAYELGYRVNLAGSVALDWTGYYFDYDRLITGNMGTVAPVGIPPVPTTHLVLPVAAANEGEGRAYGFEISAEWQATDWWRFTAAYSLFETELSAFNTSGQEPESQVSLRSAMNLSRQVELDLWGRYVSELPAFQVKSYFDFDVRLAWKPSANWELSVVGQNLIAAERFEFGPNVVIRSQATPVPRAVYGQVTVKF